MTEQQNRQCFGWLYFESTWTKSFLVEIISIKTFKYISTTKFLYLWRTALHIAIASEELVINPLDLFEVAWQIKLRAIAISKKAEPDEMHSMWLLNI